MTDLKKMYFANCSISELQKYHFENVINLEWIKLAGNSIEILFNETFHNLSNLKYLYLENNLIRDLSEGVFYQLQNLKLLNLSNNNITILPKDIFKRNTELTFLSLRGNPFKIVHLKFPMWTFREIDHLDLGDCKELRNLRLSIRVRSLRLTNSGVERLRVNGSIRKILHDNSKVTRAVFRRTRFQRSFVEVLCRMPSIEWLDLSNSSKGSDYSYFTLDDCPFSNLHSLNLSGNHLSYIPWRLDYFGPNLTTLDLSQNELGDEDEHLFDWNSDVGYFQNLRYLNMSRNKLRKISGRFHLILPKLTILDLSHNLLEDVSLDFVDNRRNLQSLYLEGNRLASFDYLSVCKRFKNLKRLTLYDNMFNSTFYGNMSKYLSDNDLSAEPRPQSET